MKRNITDSVSVTKDAKVIMLDIEGTTTSISFVKEELFPYVRREVKSYLQTTWDDPQTKDDVAVLSKQIEADVAAGVSGMEMLLPSPDEGEDDHAKVISSLVSNIHAMMDADRKIGPLKILQGHMWRRAYSDGTVKGHVYEDVLEALEEWKTEGKKIVIYSSGSVEAQKLLFGHSCYGDLLHYFSNHFDTKVGSKVESESYRKILQELNCEPHDVIFITDLPQEAWAANDAGLKKVVLSVREGTAPLSAKDKAAFRTINSFSQLLDHPPMSTKRLRTEEEEESDAPSQKSEEN